MSDDQSNVALAFLVLPDGAIRQVCVGCSAYLHERGMLSVAGKTALNVVNAPDGETPTSIAYMIAKPWTLAECRNAISGRHRGRLWGS